ncbi:MAG: phosphoribosylanthranilate isomerase [Candidatus Geothermincolia bacterium]
MWVKICGITRLEDAVSAARFGADAVGFVFAKSPRRVTPDAAREIAHEMPDGPAKVGVFVDCPLEEVIAIAEHVRLDMVQLHGDEGYEYCSALGGRAIKAMRVGGTIDIARATRYAQEGACDALLLDAFDPSRNGGTGRTFDWKMVKLIEGSPRVIIAGGLGPANVGEAVKMARPYGVDASSGIEKSPGVKDPVLMYKFIEKARKADYEVSNS